MQAPIETRDYQQRIITKVLAEYKKGLKSVLLVSPCGSGKTVMGLSILKILEELDPTLTFGWVTMRRKLLQQAFIENERIGVKNIEFISMFDRNPPKKRFLVIDEGHHAAAATCANLYSIMGIERSLALTGTPFRTDRIKLSFEKIVDDCGVRFLIEKGYLSPYQQFVIPKWTPDTVAKMFLQDPKRWGKSVIYMKTVELCDEVVRLLDLGGIRSRVIHGGQSNETHEEIYESFESGETQALVNVYLLTEGFDLPSLQTAWIRDSGKLTSIQMGGRTLRKDPNNPGKIANIVQSEETWFPYTKVAKPSGEFVWQDEEWRSIEANERVANVSDMVRNEILTLPVELPAYLEYGAAGSIRVNKKGKVTVRKSRKVVSMVASMLGALDAGEFDDDGDLEAAV
jgi:superfamily II DNA or RNA helicase